MNLSFKWPRALGYNLRSEIILTPIFLIILYLLTSPAGAMFVNEDKHPTDEVRRAAVAVLKATAKIFDVIANAESTADPVNRMDRQGLEEAAVMFSDAADQYTNISTNLPDQPPVDMQQALQGDSVDFYLRLAQSAGISGNNINDRKLIFQIAADISAKAANSVREFSENPSLQSYRVMQESLSDITFGGILNSKILQFGQQ